MTGHSREWMLRMTLASSQRWRDATSSLKDIGYGKIPPLSLEGLTHDEANEILWWAMGDIPTIPTRLRKYLDDCLHAYLRGTEQQP